MNQLTKKEVAAYLPYGVEIYHSQFMFREVWNKPNKGTLIGITSIIPETFDIVMLRDKDNYHLQDSIAHFKLALRPLSDLTKEIEHNGERFIPLYRLMKEDKAFTTSFIDAFGYEELKVSVYELLLEWHFDIFHLIPNGLALDLNKT